MKIRLELTIACIVGIFLISFLSRQCQKLCWLSLAFIIDRKALFSFVIIELCLAFAETVILSFQKAAALFLFDKSLVSSFQKRLMLSPLLQGVWLATFCLLFWESNVRITAFGKCPILFIWINPAIKFQGFCCPWHLVYYIWRIQYHSTCFVTKSYLIGKGLE